jgi:hypothetical protein
MANVTAMRPNDEFYMMGRCRNSRAASDTRCNSAIEAYRSLAYRGDLLIWRSRIAGLAGDCAASWRRHAGGRPDRS